MSENNYFKFSNMVLIAPLVGVIAIWSVYWLELILETNFNVFGVFPRSWIGLRGIVLSPFIHGSLEHLYNNTIPLVILMASLFYFYKNVAIRVLVYGILLSGLVTWIIGRPSYHIGASGLIYVLASFIFFKGVFTKYYRLVALSLMVVFVYGSLLWYIFPIKDGISWEGHLGGFLTGMLLSFIIKARTPLPKKFVWERDDYKEEEDPFLKHFDENGNFIEFSENNSEEPNTSIEVNYHYKKDGPEK
nr:rhomboid family intramembrane serine protease [Maribacter sp.]